MQTRKIKIILVVLGILALILLIVAGIIVFSNRQITTITNDVFNNRQIVTRTDGAQRVTNCYPESCQNPVFSPDGKYLVFTRFQNSYNKGPAKIVKINLESKKENIIVNLEGDNVNVPFGSWVYNKITFAAENGIATSNDDGSDIQLHLRNADKVYYLEPVFNPSDANKIVLESLERESAKNEIHQIKLLELDKNNRITALTGGGFDDRLPSWSPDGKKILWQRYTDDAGGKPGWRVFIADIVLEPEPRLNNIIQLTNGPDDTDNSWTWDLRFVLSSRTGDGKVPNIFAYSLSEKKFARITRSDFEDGAPSSSPDTRNIAFESHQNQDENSPTEIWLITNPVFEYNPIIQNHIIQNKPEDKLENVKTYANTYIDYTQDDIEKLKKFDIVMIEPYNMKREWLAELKKAGTIVIAYVSVGEADDDRRYWKNWQPSERAYEIDAIPRTVVNENNPMFIGPDPGWPGSYFVDASNEKWQKIMLEEEIPYILALGDGLYDGLVMDLIDVVDEYEDLPREQEMRQGMIDLIRKIKEKYPDKIIIPNRGFGILREMGPHIDAFKFEELTLKYNNIPGETNYGKYDKQLDFRGNHQNQEQIDRAVQFAKEYNRPIFVLDHVETEPPDTNLAEFGYKEAEKLGQKYNASFIWYANSVDQDLQVWSFIEYSK